MVGLITNLGLLPGERFTFSVSRLAMEISLMPVIVFGHLFIAENHWWHR